MCRFNGAVKRGTEERREFFGGDLVLYLYTSSSQTVPRKTLEARETMQSIRRKISKYYTF